MNAEELYNRLGRLIAGAPKIDVGPTSEETRIWLAQAYALVHAGKDTIDYIRFKDLTTYLSIRSDEDYQREIFDILYRTLAIAELNAPASSQGAFIPAGNTLDAMTAVGKVLSGAKQTALIVDPYMDEKALTDFALLANEEVAIRLLTDSSGVKATLSPAVTRWKQQYTNNRPLEARVAWQPRLLHDRTIIVDDQTVWILTQSLNAFAARSPAAIVRVEGDAVKLKLDAYADFWTNGLALP